MGLAPAVTVEVQDELAAGCSCGSDQAKVVRRGSGEAPGEGRPMREGPNQEEWKRDGREEGEIQQGAGPVQMETSSSN